MLKIFNDMEPFFEDSYRRINVREYARLQKISAPTAATLLQQYSRENLLKMERERQYLFYTANKESHLFIDLAKIYWKTAFEKAGLLDFLEKELVSPLIILFGSLAKAEVTPTSDIDLAVFTATNKELSLHVFEKKLKRPIQLFLFHEKADVKNDELLNSILNGYRLRGAW